MTESSRGSNGGKKRAEKLSKEQRSAIAKDAAKRRWSKIKKQPKIDTAPPVNIVPDEVNYSELSSAPTIAPIPEPPEEVGPKHCPACFAGQSLEEGTHILATIEHPLQALNHFPSVVELPKQPEPLIPLQTPRKRQAKPIPKAFKGASSYAEKRLAEALKERAEYMGRVAALNAEIPSLVSVIRALGGNPMDTNLGQIQHYPTMDPYHQSNGLIQAPPAVDQLQSVPNIDPALFQTNAGPVPGITAPRGPMTPQTAGGGAADLDYVPRDDEGPGLSKIGGGWQ